MSPVFGASGSAHESDHDWHKSQPAFGSDGPKAGRAGSPSKGTRAKRKKKPAPFDRIVELCAVRDRSQHELSERLAREGYETGERDDAIGRAVLCGIVDDIRFADGLVRARVAAGKGEALVRRDLAKHGIDPSDLPGWPEAYALGGDAQIERAVRFLNDHPPTAKDAYQAAFRKLSSKGYSKQVASQAVRQWHAQRPDAGGPF